MDCLNVYLRRRLAGDWKFDVSKNQLARLFKSARGMTPRAWRKQS